MHSGVLKCLTNLALILKLDEILCSSPGKFSFDSLPVSRLKFYLSLILFFRI